MAYAERLLAYYRAPSRVGIPAGAVAGEAGRVSEGRLVRMGVVIADGEVRDAGFLAFGCPATIACAAWLADWLPGRSTAEAGRLRGLDMAAALELPADRLTVALVVEDALAAALAAAQGPEDAKGGRS